MFNCGAMMEIQSNYLVYLLAEEIVSKVLRTEAEGSGSRGL